VPTVTIIPGHIGTEREADRALESLRDCGSPVEDTTTRMSYLDLLLGGRDARDQPLDTASTFVAWDTYLYPFDGDPVVQKETLLQEHSGLPATDTTSPGFVLWRTVLADPPEHPSAAPRLPGITTHLAANWSDPGREEAQMGWLDRTADVLVRSGATDAANTLNHFSSMTDERLRRIYGAATYDRIARLKAIHDPDNVFHRNVNIPPRP
jgi:hypothetical protein